MSVSPELVAERIVLRQWRDRDLAPFAQMNSNPQVMAYFPSPLSRKESDELASRIQTRLRKRGFGFWAVEIPGVAEFAGFIGLSIPGFEAHFTPCVEIGWRLDLPYWGKGYATEGAQACLEFGFQTLHLAEIVSFTAASNWRSRGVMAKIGMKHNPQDDFQHPLLIPTHPLSHHVLYRIDKQAFLATSH